MGVTSEIVIGVVAGLVVCLIQYFLPRILVWLAAILMGGDERSAHMNTDAFRSHFSPEEQQMIRNLTEVLPSK